MYNIFDIKCLFKINTQINKKRRIGHKNEWKYKLLNTIRYIIFLTHVKYISNFLFHLPITERNYFNKFVRNNKSFYNVIKYFRKLQV